MQSSSIQSPSQPVHGSDRGGISTARYGSMLLPGIKATIIAASFLVAIVPRMSNQREESLDKQLETSSLRPVTVAPSPQSDYLHAVGSHLEDQHGHPFIIRAINWSGFETSRQTLGGLDSEDYGTILARVKADGFNVIRIPFSNEMVEAPIIPFTVPGGTGERAFNTDLCGLNSIEILDRIVTTAASLGLKVVLDNHRSEAGSSAQPSGLWFTERYKETAWINDWLTLTERYRDNPNVIGVDLRNEPHNALSGGACWGCMGPRDWRLAAERAGNAVLSKNPNILIIVEGTDSAEGQTTWWGGNLAGVRSAPVRLSRPSQLVYSAHVYGPTEYKQAWFTETTTPTQLWSLWDKQWGFLSTSGIAPVLVGEFGLPNNVSELEVNRPGTEGQWFNALLTYFRLHPNLGWAYWSLNSEDAYGWLDRNYSSAPDNTWRNTSIRLLAADNSGTSDSVYSSVERDTDPVSQDKLLFPPMLSSISRQTVEPPTKIAGLTTFTTTSPMSKKSQDVSVSVAVQAEVNRVTAKALAER